MPWRSIRGVLLLVALMAAPARARPQGPGNAPMPRVSGRSVALVVARVETPLPGAAAPVSQDDLGLAPPANDVGTPSAWRRWAARRAGSQKVSYVGDTPEPAAIALRDYPTPPATFSERLTACGVWVVDETVDNFYRLLGDFRHLYTGENLCYLGLAIGVAAPFAHTYADRRINDWYQHNVRSYRSEEWARAGYVLGQHEYTIPLYLGVMAAGAYWQDTEAGSVAYTWSNRAIRALAVGGPAVGVLQYGLGAGRPTEGDTRWHPFRDNNSVCGHGYVGAVPFLAAATVVDSPALKAFFFAGSFWTSWARLNTEDHSVSQIILGWSIAFLSVRSVVQTDRERWLEIVPIEEQRGAGMGVQFRF